MFQIYLALISAQTHDQAMPSYARAMQEGDVEAAHRHARRLGGDDGTADAPALQALGDAALLLGYEEDAEDHFRRAQKLQGSNDAVRLLSCRNAGWQALNLHRYSAALHCFARIVQDGAATVPQKAEAVLGAALVHHQLGQQAACDDALRQARALGEAAEDGRWLLLADLLALDCAVRLGVRCAAGLRDHVFWQSAAVRGDHREEWQRFADAMAACDARRPAPELAARRHACLALLLRLADGERDVVSVLYRHSAGDVALHVEIALAALAGDHVDLAEQSLQRGRHADPRDRRWSLDQRYCQAKIAMLKGDSAAALKAYAAYTAEALQCLRSETQVIKPLDGMAPPAAQPSDDISARLPAKYRRAYRYIADHYRNNDLSTGEIAAHIGVTERALQLAFRENLGMSPTAVLRRMRLDAVRAELLAEDGASDGILKTAHRLGLKSRSSLIRGYRKQFNEAPSASAASAAAHTIPWRTGSIKYVADHKDVKEILRELAASQNVMASISPQVEGNVTGSFAEPPQRFLDHLAASFGFVWYYDGTVLYVAGANEVKSASIGFTHAHPADLRAAVTRLHIADPRFAIVYDDPTDTVLVSGPPRYVELVTELAHKIDVDHQQRRTLEVRVFPLRYAWAADHPLRIGGQQVTLPGVAGILRSIYQKNAAAPPLAQVATGLVARVASVAPKTEQPAAPGGFWSAALPGLGGADSTPRKPPLPAGTATEPAAPAGQGTAAAEDDMPTIQPDPRTNAVLVRDLPEKMADYERLIATLDTRPQVLEISASIIDVTENALAQLGVDWRLHGSHVDLETGAGNLAQASFPGSLNPSGFGTPTTDNTPALTPTGGTLTAVLGGAGRYLLARVSALEQTSEARITASPKVATLDHVEAVMDNKTTFYVPVAGYQSSDLYSVSAGTSLRVLPMVVPQADGGIRLTVHIEDGQLTGQLVGQLPVVSNSEIDTEALIRDGESLLIGGYSVEQSTTGNTDVPFLSKLPVVGALFKNKQDQKQKFRRLFLLTPRIVTPT